MECIINGTKVKYEDGKIWKFGKVSWNSREKWIECKGCIWKNKTNSYQCNRIHINYKSYNTSRVIYKCHHPEWNIEDSSPTNTIDHISRDSLDNRIENLKVATMAEQSLNRTYVLEAKGYRLNHSKWEARIKINCKEISLGRFELEVDARQAYLDAVQKYRPI